ncbi:MAG: glycosyltransferase [Deltaproteobacteria bacterium]|jgi:Flp pilus assembly protein TadD|nr:glycosyltransferase [Deltaproteobacteria bacterium]
MPGAVNRGAGGRRPTLGLAMIMRDEAANLPFSLGPAAELFDEMVCVDTGSTDSSPETAAGYGARVLHLPWPGDFSAARNYGLDRMTADYVLWLDADNSLTPSDVSLLRARLDGGPLVLTAVEVVAPQGDRLRQKRVFFNDPQCRFEGRVHEQLRHPPQWPTVATEAVIRHWGYADGAQARRKGERNLELLLSDPETARGEFYRLYQTGRTLTNLRFLQQAEHYLVRAADALQRPDGTTDPEINLSLWSHALILLAQTQGRLGRHDQAEETLRLLVELRPDYGPGRQRLGRALYEAGRWTEARRHLEKALAAGCGDLGWGADPRREGFTAASILAKILAKAGEADQARLAWRQAAELAPARPEPWVALAEAELEAGRPQEAKKMLEKAMRLAPGHRLAVSLAGRIDDLTDDLVADVEAAASLAGRDVSTASRGPEACP